MNAAHTVAGSAMSNVLVFATGLTIATAGT